MTKITQHALTELLFHLLWLPNLKILFYNACYCIFRWQEVVCGFLSEALAGSHTAVHTIFYEVDDEDGLIAIPGKYADRGQTAECLKQMARAVNGRFHWYRSGGIFNNPHLNICRIVFLYKIALIKKHTSWWQISVFRSGMSHILAMITWQISNYSQVPELFFDWIKTTLKHPYCYSLRKIA